MRLWSSRCLSPLVTSWVDRSRASRSMETLFSIMRNRARLRKSSLSMAGMAGSMASWRARYFWSKRSLRVLNRASFPSK